MLVGVDTASARSSIPRTSRAGLLRRIAANAGPDGGVVVQHVKTVSGRHGLDASTGRYVDMLAAGIVDPATVTRSALQNAASIAGLFLTTEAVVAEKPEPDKTPAGAGAGADKGM